MLYFIMGILMPKNSQLLELSVPNGGSFYCLEETPLFESNGRAVIFLHGLGENRTGLNYLFHELSRGLTAEGFVVYRFDLGGRGESELPLSLSIWKKQLECVKTLLKERYSKIHLIARGAASLLLPSTLNPIHIAIGPVIVDFFLKQYLSISVEECKKNWIPKADINRCSKRDYFWTLLGVEAECLGGFYISRAFLTEMRNALNPIPKEWAVIYAGKGCPISIPSHANYLPDCHPLFFHENDRKILLKKIIEILE
jgi:hypothetical protein